MTHGIMKSLLGVQEGGVGADMSEPEKNQYKTLTMECLVGPHWKALRCVYNCQLACIWWTPLQLYDTSRRYATVKHILKF